MTAGHVRGTDQSASHQEHVRSKEERPTTGWTTPSPIHSRQVIRSRHRPPVPSSSKEPIDQHRLGLEARQLDGIHGTRKPPFPGNILMWWTVVARTEDEMAQARADWETGQRFGHVPAYKGPRLSAPSLVRFARSNPLS